MVMYYRLHEHFGVDMTEIKLTEVGIQEMISGVCSVSPRPCTDPLIIILLSDMFRERFSHALRQARCGINYETGAITLAATISQAMVNSIRIAVLTSTINHLDKMCEVVDDHKMTIDTLSHAHGMSFIAVSCSCGHQFARRAAHFMAQRDMLLHYRMACAGILG